MPDPNTRHRKDADPRFPDKAGQPGIPDTPATPAAGAAQPSPSAVLNQGDVGMVSQADMDDRPGERERAQRRENVNPSREREEPAED